MPFDLSGNFTRAYNFQQDRDNNVKILASHVDGEFDNIASGMNLVFFRDGRVPMLADLRMNINGITGLKDGAVGTPAIKFNTEANTGPYLDGAGRYAIAVQGVRRGVFTATGFDIVGNGSYSGTLSVTGNVTFAGALSVAGAITNNGAPIATLASPAFTGTPTAPTPATADNTTKLATTAYVQAQGYTTLANAAITLAPKASPSFTGNITASQNGMGILFTDTAGFHPYWACKADNTLALVGTNADGSSRTIMTIPMSNNTSTLTIVAPAAFSSGIAVTGTITATGAITQGGVAVALVASPAFTGVPTAPTAAAGDNSTQIATTAFVDKLRGLPSRSVAGTTLVVTDRGNLVKSTAAITVPANVFAADDVVAVYNNSGAGIALTQGAGLTQRLNGTATTGSLTLAQRGQATILFISATECVVSGAVS